MVMVIIVYSYHWIQINFMMGNRTVITTNIRLKDTFNNAFDS